MTLDDLSAKMEARFDRTDGKLDSLTTTVAVHTTTIATNEKRQDNIDARLTKIEKIIWFALGGSGAAGFGIAKLFCS